MTLTLSCGILSARTDTLKYHLDFNGEICRPAASYYSRTAWNEGNLWHIKDYYTQEQALQMDGLFRDSLAKVGEGQIIYYHTNGQPSQYETYRNGKKNGLITRFNKNGVMTDSMMYKNDVGTGTCKSWYDNRQLKFVGIYDTTSQCIGEQLAYYKNGILSEHSYTHGYNYKEGFVLLDSTCTFFDTSGRCTCKANYKSGKLQSMTCYNSNGAIQKKCKEYVDNKPRHLHRLLKPFKHQIKDSLLYYCPELKGNKLDGSLVMKVIMDIDGSRNVSVIRSLNPCIDQILVNIFATILKVTQLPVLHNRPVNMECYISIDFPSKEIFIKPI